jgi:ferritin-like metal-binding protein YciE
MNEEPTRVLQGLLAEERQLNSAYRDYLRRLHPPVLREKVQRWAGEGWKHIEALEREIEKRGAAPDRSTAPAPAVPASDEAHDLLDFFFRKEERLYYSYQEALKRAEEKEFRSLLFRHLEEQKGHVAGIQNLYAEFLYY